MYHTKFIFYIFLSLLIIPGCGHGGGNSNGGSNALRHSEANLNDFWDGTAHFERNAEGVGKDFDLEFTSTVVKDNLFYSYYVLGPLFTDGNINFSTGLATSKDGLNYKNIGEVMPAGGNKLLSLSVEKDFHHQIGNFEDGCGWRVSTDMGEGYALFGSNASQLEAGEHTAVFVLKGLNTPKEFPLAKLEVTNAESGEVIAAKLLTRDDLPYLELGKRFLLEFVAPASGKVDFYVYSYAHSDFCIQDFSVSIGSKLSRDNRIASFPSVWHSGGQWTMVYEGASTFDLSVLGEVRLATSSDGIHWGKEASPIVTPDANWEKVNIGTPSIWKEDATWYLFYHGFDGKRLQVGVATGTDLHSLKFANNRQPVLTTGNGWDSGTIGKRSIIFNAPYYYMAYEGSDLPAKDGDFGNARWGTGLARSIDLIHWEKYPMNPILGPTEKGFGYDGPDIVKDPLGSIHIFYRSPEGLTNKITLIQN